MPLSKTEYQYLSKLDERVELIQKELENDDSFEEMFQIEELDVAYHILL